MPHVVDRILASFVSALTDQTDAAERVTRDRVGLEFFEADTDLPAIDVRLGEETVAEIMANGLVRSDVEVFVDLYTAETGEIDGPTAHLLELRAQSYEAIMRDAPAFRGISNVLRVIPGGADAPVSTDRGAIPTASMRTIYVVHYQHNLTDATR